jgi:hypothetical protein
MGIAARAERYSGIPAMRNAAKYSFKDWMLASTVRARSLVSVI